MIMLIIITVTVCSCLCTNDFMRIHNTLFIKLTCDNIESHGDTLRRDTLPNKPIPPRTISNDGHCELCRLCSECTQYSTRYILGYCCINEHARVIMYILYVYVHDIGNQLIVQKVELRLCAGVCEFTHM